MIDSAVILNFQSHKRTELHFDRGVNVIIGNSDGGKSAILRAFYWLIWNRPLGDSVVSDWVEKKDYAVIQVWTERGHVSREIRNGENVYTEHAQLFKAFKTEVPKEVKEHLNMNEINFQRQLDAPFLLSVSSGEVAQVFNKVARLENIDTGNQNIKSWIRGLEGNIKEKKASIAETEKELETYDRLQKIEAKLEVAEGIEKLYDAAVGRHTRLLQLINNIKEIQEEIDTVSQILRHEPTVNKILAKIQERDKLESEYSNLEYQVSLIENTERVLPGLKSLIEHEAKVDKILKLYEDKEALDDKYTKFREQVDSINTTKAEVNEKKTLVDSLTKQFDKEFPDMCPLCGKPK